MYHQLLNKYTVKEYLSHQQTGHIALYIAPNGRIFDCRRNGVIGHATFSTELYKNYKQMMETHRDIDFDTELSEFILSDETFSFKDVKNFYLDQFDFLQYENMPLYSLLRMDYLGIDSIPVQDLGFVRVSVNIGELPVINLPLSVFNGKEMTSEQYEVLMQVLKYNTLSYQDYSTSRLISKKIKETKMLDEQLKALKDENKFNR